MVAEEQVLGFDVSVDHVLFVAVDERISHLLDVLRRPRLFETSHRSELLVKLALRSKSAKAADECSAKNIP